MVLLCLAVQLSSGLLPLSLGTVHLEHNHKEVASQGSTLSFQVPVELWTKNEAHLACLFVFLFLMPVSILPCFVFRFLSLYSSVISLLQRRLTETAVFYFPSFPLSFSFFISINFANLAGVKTISCKVSG